MESERARPSPWWRRLLKRWKEDAQFLTILGFYRAAGWFDVGRSRLVYRPVLQESPPRGDVLVVAPHVDDEVFGCGGTLHLHHLAGDRITVVYLTDGARGSRDQARETSLIERRRREARASAEIIGFDRLEFLGFADQELRGRVREAAAALERLLRDDPCRRIYLPFPLDYHPDHVAAARIVLEALSGGPADGELPALTLYECLAPMFPNAIQEISRVVEVKRRAVLAQQSQQADHDYVSVVVEGLNRFRTHGLLRGLGYAEAFFHCDLPLLRRICEQLQPLGIPD
jgi:LmbE family N-acetylglucosaminyl deacetylase